MAGIRRASALLLRRSIDDERVHLARRRDEMRFFGGVYAFCGGTVDPVDETVAATAPGGGTPLDVLRSTLLREMIEELGVDFRESTAAASAVDDATRRGLLDRPGLWAEMARGEDLGCLEAPVLRLITPDFYPLRFDTWFFLATLDDRARPRPWPEELDDDGWDTPAGWLRRWNRGEILLAPPTVLTLQAMDGVPWSGLGEALAALQSEVESDTPQPIHNDPAVRLIPLRTPTLPPARHTNAYLVGRDPAYLIDPATPHPAEQERLARAVERARTEGFRLRAILLTHHHHDHVGAVDFARRRWGLPVYAHAETARRVDVPVDRSLEDEERLDLGATPDGREPWTLRCLFTPGHAPGHLCFLDSAYGALVAGDMVSTLSSILVHPDDGDLDLYLRSLERLAALPVRVVYPAHGPADAGGTRILDEQRVHRLERERAVIAAIRDGARDVEELTARVYVDVPRPMLGHAAHSVRSILHRLEAHGRLRLDGDRVDALC